MPMFLFHVNFSAAGNKGVLAAGGTSRLRAVEDLAGSVGGTVESLYFVLGGDESMAICELPSNEAATAFALAVGSTGALEVRTIALLRPSDVDAATQLSPVFRAPGD
jgi:uncharacterized protein with GYD domain